MGTLQEALRAAGIRTTAPNKTIDLQIINWQGLFVFAAETWQGHQFLEATTDQRGEAYIDDAKRANGLARQAAGQGLNVTLDGKPYKGDQ